MKSQPERSPGLTAPNRAPLRIPRAGTAVGGSDRPPRTQSVIHTRMLSFNHFSRSGVSPGDAQKCSLLPLRPFRFGWFVRGAGHREGRWSYSALLDLLSGAGDCANEGGVPDTYLKTLLPVSFHLLLSTSLKLLGSPIDPKFRGHPPDWCENFEVPFHRTFSPFAFMFVFWSGVRSLDPVIPCTTEFLEVFTTGGLNFSCDFI